MSNDLLRTLIELHVNKELVDFLHGTRRAFYGERIRGERSDRKKKEELFWVQIFDDFFSKAQEFATEEHIDWNSVVSEDEEGFYFTMRHWSGNNWYNTRRGTRTLKGALGVFMKKLGEKFVNVWEKSTPDEPQPWRSFIRDWNTGIAERVDEILTRSRATGEETFDIGQGNEGDSGSMERGGE